MASHEEIDDINILRASLLAMKRAIDGLGTKAWSLALVDGNWAVPGLPVIRQQAVVRGDAMSASVAAASIVAKVTRDRLMQAYHDQYPGYGFAVHKGYPTALHREKIRRLGLCGIHRKTFCGTEKLWRK
jgi:ribonuclease HII